jgi:hypothetical protein
VFKRSSIFVHRWLGVALCLFFLEGTALCVTSLVLAWRVIGAYFFSGVQRAGLSAGPMSR